MTIDNRPTELASEYAPLQYTNIAVNPDGTIRPWPTHKTTTHPPVLRTDGQITWLPSERLAGVARELATLTERNQ